MGRAIVWDAVTLFSGIICIVGVETVAANESCSAQDSPKPTAQERIAQRDIQEAIDQEIEELGAKDLAALSRQMPPDFTVRLLDGTTLNREQVMEGMRQDL